MCRRTLVWTAEAGLTMDPWHPEVGRNKGGSRVNAFTQRRKQPEWILPMITQNDQTGI